MSLNSGWCQGPPGARIHHENCPSEVCSCPCHLDTDRLIAQGKVLNWDQIETAPGGALTPESQGLAELVRSSTDG